MAFGGFIVAVMGATLILFGLVWRTNFGMSDRAYARKTQEIAPKLIIIGTTLVLVGGLIAIVAALVR